MSETTTEYGIKHAGSAEVQTDDDEFETFVDLQQVRDYITDGNYRNAIPVTREVGAWTEVSA